MRRMTILAVSMLLPLLLLALPVAAEEQDSTNAVSVAMVDQKPGAVKAPDESDQEVAAKTAEFKRFAKTKVEQLNRNLMFNRNKMQITKQADGNYRARYHRINHETLKSKVNRSRSKSSPFVGVLSYREEVYESCGRTPDDCRNGNFTLVQITPNRHIFSYSKGAWR